MITVVTHHSPSNQFAMDAIAPTIYGLPDLDIRDSSDIESDSVTTNLSDEESIAFKDDYCLLLVMALSLYVTMLNLFQPIELSRENQISVNPMLPMNNLLGRLAVNPTQFKDLTNFTVDKFIELCRLVVPTIEGHARSTRVRHKISERPIKLTIEHVS